jgi:uncharacterized protein
LQGASIDDYGYQLGRRWRIGQEDKNNGVLLIVALNERQVRIEVGYGLEGTLTDAITKLIIENSILPRIKAGDIPGGIRRGTEDIIQVLSGDAEEWQRRASQSPPGTARPDAGASIWSAIIVVLVAAGLLIFCAAAGGAMCQAILQVLFVMLPSGGRGSSRHVSSWSGRGGSFGGGGASGRW